MINRTLSLVIFRGSLLALTLGYQLLALLFPFPRLPFEPVFWVVLVLSLFNLGYAWYLLKGGRSGPNFVFFQLTVDIVFISVLVVYTGGIQSNLKFAYLIFLLLSALYLERISIYALTMLSLALYYFSLSLGVFLQIEPTTVESIYWSEKVARATTAQFVLCFLAALLAGFMQNIYRGGRRALELKERDIRNLRAMRRKIVEALPSGLMLCRHNGGIDFINEVGKKLLQLGEDFKEVNAWRLLQLNPAGETGSIRHRGLVRTERTLRLGGARRVIGISFTPMDEVADPGGYMIVFQDLTKVKMLEAHKSLNERMTAIGKVAAGVAHEIRNPLAAISGSVQVLKELTPEDDSAQELAGIVVRETNRLDQIISQFMAYARPGPPAAFIPVDLGEAINDFLKLTKNDVRLKTLELVSECEDGCFILADQGKLTQVFWNLTSNSFYASQEGGKVVLGCFTQAEDAVFFIQDFGKGMSEDQVRDLFTPFQSFSKSGTGLGMSIVYDIINTHHGRIDVKSRPGEGTRIEIRFAMYHE